MIFLCKFALDLRLLEDEINVMLTDYSEKISSQASTNLINAYL